MSVISNWIKTNRERLGYNQEDLATLLCCSQQCIQNYEKDKRRPDLELLSQMAALFGSELKIGIDGIQILSPSNSVWLESTSLGSLLTVDSFDNALIETAHTVLKERIEPYLQGIYSDQVSLMFGNHRLTLENLKQLTQRPKELDRLGSELEGLVEQYFATHEKDLAEVLPHELGGLGNYCCNLMFGDVGLDASVNISLYSEEVEDGQFDWYWYLYSEIEGCVDYLSYCSPLSSLTGTEVLLCFVDLIEEFLNLDDIKGLIRDYCQEQLIA